MVLGPWRLPSEVAEWCVVSSSVEVASCRSAQVTAISVQCDRQDRICEGVEGNAASPHPIHHSRYLGTPEHGEHGTATVHAGTPDAQPEPGDRGKGGGDRDQVVSDRASLDYTPRTVHHNSDVERLVALRSLVA